MQEIWARIEAVLRVTEPELLATLAAGATHEAIQEAEARLGVALPPDVCESYSIHNGSGEFGLLPSEYYAAVSVPLEPLHSLDEIVREWQMWQEWSQKYSSDESVSSEGPIKFIRHNPRWLPVSWDGGGGNLCIDLDPGPQGVMGQVIYLDHLDPVCVAAVSWRTFLESFAERLESGRLRFGNEELSYGDDDPEYAAALRSLIEESRQAESDDTTNRKG